MDIGGDTWNAVRRDEMLVREKVDVGYWGAV
jgi:hypothetical protein